MHATIAFLSLCALGGAPTYLDDRFDLPAGFRIYRAAGADLTGGSYDLAIDGQGRLLAGDGGAVRRLADDDGDGVFDRAEVVGSGLGPRGPQGLLVLGDRLYAVGGDGIQLFTGYAGGGPLRHEGRLGVPFQTGGDHDAHTIFRGHDGWLYFITGDGGGTRDRRHITEESSPALFERSCSVFRLDPAGKRWECIGSGGRNAPNLGMNFLGELFSLDSDMEWHVGLPWWRPVRLNHWLVGGDQGWQNVGAFPSYSIDCLPGIHDVGRGSPDWGVFYEHTALPERYRDAYLVCDYLWKSATSGGYETAGQVLCFFLERRGAGWTATREVLARPRPGARDEHGRQLLFAAVDIEVAPDGSLLVSEHNQGVWRIVYAPGAGPADPPPPLVAGWNPRGRDLAALVDEILALPQPGAEWSRLRLEALRARAGEAALSADLRRIALAAAEPLARRLRAIRVLAPEFDSLESSFLESLAGAESEEVRGQAAWLLGLRSREAELAALLRLLADRSAFVRRRAAEALTRQARPAAIGPLIAALADPERLVRYAAMTALSHHAPAAWLEGALQRPEPQVVMRALAAAHLRRQPAGETEARVAAGKLLETVPSGGREDALDLLRILDLHRRAIEGDDALRGRAEAFILRHLESADPDLRRESVRLLGAYRVQAAFGKLLAHLEAEKDPAAQFHAAQALSRLPGGWTQEEDARAVTWFIGTQEGWFSEFAGKGLEFPHFLATVLADFAARHREALLARLTEVKLSSRLGGAVIDLLAEKEDAAATLIALYRARQEPDVRRRLATAMGGVRAEAAGVFLREEYLRLAEPGPRGAVLQSLARRPPEAPNGPLLEEGLLHRDPDVVNACARALAGYKLEPEETRVALILSILDRRGDVQEAAARLLVAVTGVRPPGLDADAGDGERRSRRASREKREESAAFWKAWYRERFGREPQPPAELGARERPDEEIRAFLLSDAAAGGDPERGKAIYEAARCASCHGGGAARAALFGPDLAGVTQRLSREELADALVNPSKQVADRFKAAVVQVRGEAPLTGFITEASDESVTLVSQERVHKIPRARVEFQAPLETSLMPERLLNRLTPEELRDLLAYIHKVPAAETGNAGAKG